MAALLTLAQPTAGTGSTATIVLAPAGAYGAITVDVTLGVPNVTVTGTITVAFNTTATAQTVRRLDRTALPAGLLRVGGENLDVSRCSARASPATSPSSRSPPPAGATVVRIGLANVRPHPRAAHRHRTAPACS